MSAEVMPMRATSSSQQQLPKTPVSSASTVSDQEEDHRPGGPEQTLEKEGDKGGDSSVGSLNADNKPGRLQREPGPRPRGDAQGTPSASDPAKPTPSPAAGGKASGSGAREGRKGTPWTEAEHVAFLDGLKVLGKGNWRGISKKFVPTRTPTQVASHAQKHFLRVTGATKRKSRFTALEQAFNNSYSAGIYNLDASKRKSFDEAGKGSPLGAKAGTAGAGQQEGGQAAVATAQAQAQAQAVAAQAAAAAQASASILGTSPPSVNPYLANPFLLVQNQQQQAAMMGLAGAPLEVQLALQQMATQQQLTQQMMQPGLAYMQAMQALLATMPQFSQPGAQQHTGRGLGARSHSLENLPSMMARSSSGPSMEDAAVAAGGAGGGVGFAAASQPSAQLGSSPPSSVYKPVPSRANPTQVGAPGFAPGVLGPILSNQGAAAILRPSIGGLKNVNSTPSLPSMVQQQQQQQPVGMGFQTPSGGASQGLAGLQNSVLHHAILNSIQETKHGSEENPQA